MFTFLPQEHKARVMREYRKKLVAYYVLIAISVGFAGVLSLIPSLILVRARLDDVVSRRDVIAHAIEAGDYEGAETNVALVQEKISALKPYAERKELSFALEKLFIHLSPSIHVTSISLRRGEGTSTLGIGGVADTRDAFVLFTKSLEGEASFSDVKFPVSSLAKARDVSFTVDLKTAF